MRSAYWSAWLRGDGAWGRLRARPGVFYHGTAQARSRSSCVQSRMQLTLLACGLHHGFTWGNGPGARCRCPCKTERSRWGWRARAEGRGAARLCSVVQCGEARRGLEELRRSTCRTAKPSRPSLRLLPPLLPALLGSPHRWAPPCWHVLARAPEARRHACRRRLSV